MFQNDRNPAADDMVPLVEVPLETLNHRDEASKSQAQGPSVETGLLSPWPPLVNGMSNEDLEQYPSGWESSDTVTSGSDAGDRLVCKSHPHNRNRPALRWPTGWRLGTTLAAGLTFLVLVANVTLLGIFASKIRGSGSTASIGPVLTGDCAEIKKLNFGIHLAINILSTLLLGASNYCMQIISAPTRGDVDSAHAKGRWLQIGVPSFRNLRFIKRRRVFVWLCLAATSIPLHLVYNSIFLMSINNNAYNVYYADESFIKGASYNKTRGAFTIDPKPVQDALLSGNNTYQKLDNDECIKAYAKNLIENRGTVILVVEQPQNCSVFDVGAVYGDRSGIVYMDGPAVVYMGESPACTDPSTTSLYYIESYTTSFLADQSGQTNWYNWICSQEPSYSLEEASEPQDFTLCSDGQWREHLGAWKVGNTKVKYCLSEHLPSRCELQVATNLIGVVIAFNVMKLIIILIMTTSNWISSHPLVTVCDAAASFIERPDPQTVGMCLMTAKEILSLRKNEKRLPQVFRLQTIRWASAVSNKRWAVLSFLTLTAISTILGLLGFAITVLSYVGKSDFKSIWSLGVGAITPYTLIRDWAVPTTGEGAVVSTVLITNSPQVLLSFLYLILNGTITAMSTTWEWTKFAHKVPRPLRVSFPEGGQRSTFFLQMPYRFSLPLMAFSVLMHWLVSQSMFITQIDEIDTWISPSDQDYERSSDTTTTAGYSPLAMILTALVVFIVFAATIGLSRLKLDASMPIVGNCSVAIAAACHVPEGTSNKRPVKWGVVVAAGPAPDGSIGHCSFSNDSVQLPEPGGRYA